MQQIARDELQQELEKRIDGDVLFDVMSRSIYSTDASLYQMMPLGVVLPKSEESLMSLVEIAREFGVPLMGRGGGTSLAGQTVTSGLVVDLSKYMNQVLELNVEERWVRVQPGIVLDNLNAVLAPHGLFFAPDVATSSRATVGGMISNNSAGVRSVRYGKTVDHVLGLTVVLSDGERMILEPVLRDEVERRCNLDSREGRLYGAVTRLIEENREEIQRRYPRVMRRVGGYNLDALLEPDEINLAKLIVGAEGTLALISEAKLSLENIPRERVVCVLHFDGLLKAIDAVVPILRYSPTAVEIIDHQGLSLAAQNPAVARLCSRFIQGNPDSILMVEFAGEQRDELEASVRSLSADADLKRLCYHLFEGWDKAAQADIWAVRKNALGVLLSMRGDAKPLPFVEDACVPVENLSAYVREVLEICRENQRPVALYAHASVGVIHIRPILNLKQSADVEILKTISNRVFDLVVRYGGAWSGEHGDGLVRSYKNPEFFGPRLMEAFRSLKREFDPYGLMNPGKIVETPAIDASLRLHPGYKAVYPDTYFRFEEEQGFDRAIEMCTGVGQCRKTLTGSMCPSYMATLDEEHSTRGRANALRMAISGQLGTEGLGSRRLYEVLDLCLECKACKSECPSSVDMAKLKSEFLAQFDRLKGLPLHKRLFAKARTSSEWGSRFPQLGNLAAQSSAFRWMLEKTVGIDRRRVLPSFARQSLVKWFQEDHRPLGGSEKIGLFADTFVNYHYPEAGIAAVELLESLGFSVELVDAGCCGRPLISCGFLAEARLQGNVLLTRMRPFLESATRVIVLEPSCLSVFRDDYLDLVEDRQLAGMARDCVCSLEEFLIQDSILPGLRKRLGQGPEKILYHGHCQQKALSGTGAALLTLGLLGGSEVQDLDSGCCGMAGSFGYEKSHYQISRRIGERVLLPAVREADSQTGVVACGFSCRSQIEHFTGRRALHLSEILVRHLDSGHRPG